METALRPMSASQVLDRTFFLYRKHFVLFAGIAVVLPALRLLSGLGELAWMGKPPVMQPGQFDPQLMQAFFARVIIAGLAGVLVWIVGTAVATSATAYAVSQVHLGKTTTIGEAYSKVKPVFGRILGLTFRVVWIVAWPLIAAYAALFLMALITPILARGQGNVGLAVGMIAFALIAFVGLLGGLVWFIYASCRYALAVPACMTENIPVRAALIRSKFFSDGSILRILGIYLLTVLMAFIVGLVLQFPVLVTHNIFTLEGQAKMGIAAMVWLQIAGFLGGLFAEPITTIAMILVYYDQRVRKEAFDLQWMMQGMPAMAASSPPPPPMVVS